MQLLCIPSHTISCYLGGSLTSIRGGCLKEHVTRVRGEIEIGSDWFRLVEICSNLGRFDQNLRECSRFSEDFETS